MRRTVLKTPPWPPGLWTGVFILVGALPAFGAPPAAPAWPVFEDATSAAGIEFSHSFGDFDLSNIVEATGSGACVFDFDDDGWRDVYFPNGRWTKGVSDNRGRTLADTLRNALYRNNGNGTFTDVTEKAGVAGRAYGFSCSTADYDADGREDLYVLNYGPNELYHNNGDGTFTEVGGAAGLADARWSLSAPWLDYNGDGRLDVYVANYLEYDEGKFRSFYAAAGFPGPLSYKGQQDALYRNNGDGTFTDVTHAVGLTNPNGRAMSAVAADLNNDGHPDLYVANDSMESYYYENTGQGTFVEKGVPLGLAFGQNGQGVSHMGPALADFDRDGRLDLMVPDMDYGTLLMNRGTYFEDVIDRSGLAVICGQYTGWGAVPSDLDHDGYPDLFIANGDPHHEYAENQVLTRNATRAPLKFIDVAAQSGAYFGRKYVARGALSVDFDNDGDQDLLVIDLSGKPHLLRHPGAAPAHHWLTLDLRRPNGKTPALGARVIVTAGPLVQVEEYVGVRGYLSQQDIRAHFGLGTSTQADTVEIRWPGGAKQTLRNVAAGQILKVVQAP